MHNFKRISIILAMTFIYVTAAPTFAQETTPEATPELTEPEITEDLEASMAAAIAILEIIVSLDEDAEIEGNRAAFTVADTPVLLVFDVRADRMRLMSQITSADDLNAAELNRLMQANFDSALDARYAIAQGMVWSTFLHPLSSLTGPDFVSGLAQTVTCVKTYGTTFSSGTTVFGGGDSNGEIQKLLEELLTSDQTPI